MSEPTSAATAAATVAPVLIGLALPSINPEALIGAFGGAVVFMMHAKSYALGKRFVYMVVSIIIGYLATPEVLQQTPIQSEVVAAFFVSLLIVQTSLVIMDFVKGFDLNAFVSRFTGGR